MGAHYERGRLGNFNTHKSYRETQAEKQIANYLMSLYEWMAEQGQGVMLKSQILLRGTRDWKLGRAMIVHTLKVYGT